MAGLRGLHRKTGVVSAILVVLIVVTGLALNHTETMQLDRTYVRSNWLLDQYDIRLPTDGRNFKAGEHWVSQYGEHLYLDGTALATQAGKLIGAVAVGDAIAVASGKELLLLTAEGELLERLDQANGFPDKPLALGVTADGRIALKTNPSVYAADPGALEWSATANAGAQWAQPEDLPEQLRLRLEQAYRGTGLPLERVLLDLHSGRFLGSWGVYAVDAIAVLFLLLALSGVWMWVRQRR